LGDKGDQYPDDMLQDGKAGNNRVVAKVTPVHIVAWNVRKLQGADGPPAA
jgi:hypothetical protein